MARRGPQPHTTQGVLKAFDNAKKTVVWPVSVAKPSNVDCRAVTENIFTAIISERGYDSWSDFQIFSAAQLSVLMAQLETEQRLLDQEGMLVTLESHKGREYQGRNPRLDVVQSLRGSVNQILPKLGLSLGQDAKRASLSTGSAERKAKSTLDKTHSLLAGPTKLI